MDSRFKHEYQISLGNAVGMYGAVYRLLASFSLVFWGDSGAFVFPFN